MVDPNGSSSWLKSKNICDTFGLKDYGEYGIVCAIVIITIYSSNIIWHLSLRITTIITTLFYAMIRYM